MFERLAGADFCYLTTTGRRSGRPHTVEMWFAIEGRTLYCLAGGGGADWVRNIRHASAVSLRINSQRASAHGRVIRAGTAEDIRARQLLDRKYMGGAPGKRLSSWARTALPVAIDLPEGPA